MNKAERREQAQLRKQRQREREREELRERLAATRRETPMVNVIVTPGVTSNPVTPEVVEAHPEPPTPISNALLVPEPKEIVTVTPAFEVVPLREPILPRIGRGLLCTVLVGSALALAGTGVVINGWYARSLGSTDFAGWLFLGVGVATDAAALALPTWATVIWQRSRRRSLAAWALWSLTFAFALSASLGFASVNIADTRLARTTATNGVIEDDKEALRVAKDREARECRSGNGTNCRKRIDEANRQQDKLDSDRGKIVGDPQPDGASKLIRWLSGDRVVPRADDFAMFRLALLTLLPQLGGLLLMVARR
jgi:hypothetical protein